MRERERERVAEVAQKRGNTRGTSLKYGTKIGRTLEISFPATFPSLPLNGLDLVRFGPKVHPNTDRGKGEEEGVVRGNHLGFCGQIRAVLPPGNSDTEGEPGKWIRQRERTK